jgi:chitinase
MLLLLFHCLLLPFTATAFKYVSYYTAWSTYGRNFQVSNIPADMLSIINYAFANIDAGGRIVLGDPYADTDKAFPGDSWDTTKQPFRGNLWQLLRVVRPKYPGLKVMISVGGWTWSGRFSDVALTDSSRQIFVQSCVDFVKLYGFDGVDL